MQSKITGGETTLLFTAPILNKYTIKYYRCNQTGFIQTEEPFWLEDAYSSAITKLDIGLPYRNINLSNTLSKVLVKDFNYKGLFLDYAGGYGLFTRLMRDKGFNFYNTDKFCQNLFAENFDLRDLPENTTFEVVTAFEVFEHLTDPLTEIRQMLQFADNLIFTTELQPATITSVSDWHYFATETGQHVSFYNTQSLKYIADILGYNFYTDGSFIHLFTKKVFNQNPLIFPKENFLIRKARKLVKKTDYKLTGELDSLLMADWKFIKDKLNN
ncbi:MAG: class I SAM-dependent methyltransferase [Mucilaginibacter sp.]